MAPRKVINMSWRLDWYNLTWCYSVTAEYTTWNTAIFTNGLLSRELTYPVQALLKMIFLFPRWDMLVPWRELSWSPTTWMHMKAQQMAPPSTIFTCGFMVTMDAASISSISPSTAVGFKGPLVARIAALLTHGAWKALLNPTTVPSRLSKHSQLSLDKSQSISHEYLNPPTPKKRTAARIELSINAAQTQQVRPGLLQLPGELWHSARLTWKKQNYPAQYAAHHLLYK